MTSRIVVHAYPRSDGEFYSTAQAHANAGVESPIELEGRLRDVWPDCRVARGITDRQWETWYAYRDGRWVDG